MLARNQTATGPPEALTIQTNRDLNNRFWDEFVASCPGGHHEQTSLWGQVKSNYGWDPVRTIFRRGGEVVGGFQLLTRKVKWIGKIGYLTRGPLSVSGDPELVQTIAAELDSMAKRERIVYLVVVPSYRGHVFLPILKRLKFYPKPAFLPPTGIKRATLILDLSRDLDQLMSDMRSSTRNQIRRGYRERIKVRQGNVKDVETFRKLMWSLCQRLGTSPTPPQKDFFDHLWNAFNPSGHIKLFLAEFENQAVCASVVFPFNDTVRFWKIGWTGDHAKRYPNNVLYWESIKWSKSNGYRYFDLVGVDLNYAEAKLRGDIPPPDSQKNGATYFKFGFGGKPLVLPEILSKVYNPAARFFIGLWGHNKFLLKIMKRTARI